MAKVTELNLVDGLDGTEQIMVAKAGQLSLVSIYDVFEYVTSNPLEPLSLTLADVSRPALVLANAVNAFGDSITLGVGSPTGEDYPNKFRAIATGQTFAFDGGEGGNNGAAIEDIANGGIGGQVSTEVTARITALAASHPAQVARPTVLCVGTNDLTLTVPGSTRNWPAQVKTQTDTAAAALTGGNRLFSLLAPPHNHQSAGSVIGADHAFHRADMVAHRGELAIDLGRWLRFYRERQGPPSDGADKMALDFGVIPFRYRGGDSDFTDADHSPIQGAGNPTDLAQPDAKIYWNTTTHKEWRKIGASGSGYWEEVDPKHFSKHGNATIARLVGDILLAEEGNGPPFAAPATFSIPADAPGGTVVGQLGVIGVADGYQLRTYDDQPAVGLTISASGEIVKSGSSPMTEGELRLIAVGGNEYGAIDSPVDILVTRPASVTKPQMRTIASPGLALCGRMAHGMADGKAFSTAHWLRPDARATQQLVLMTRSGAGNPTQPIGLALQSNGKQRLTMRDSANVQQFFDLNNTYDAGVAFWLLTAWDFETNTRCAYLTEAPQTIGDLAPCQNIPLADANPFFLAANETRLLRPLSNPFVGGVGFVAFWDSYVDWTVAANRRALFDVSGNPADRTPFAAIAGQVPKFEQWGGKGDWFAGSPDGTVGPHSLSLSHQARDLLT